MKKTDCLNEADLILHYYGELPADGEQARHLRDCPSCALQITRLQSDLARLPGLAHEPDHAAGTRMAARVTEQRHRRRRSWLPALGASAVAATALVVSIANWSPQQDPVQKATLHSGDLALMDYNEDLPDIDFLEDLELLKTLDLLSQIEGV